jgi:hypothetical protein
MTKVVMEPAALEPFLVICQLALEVIYKVSVYPNDLFPIFDYP